MGNATMARPPAIVDRDAILTAMGELDGIIDAGSVSVLDQVRRASIDVGEATRAAGVAWNSIGTYMPDGVSRESVFGAAFGTGLALGVLAARAADRQVD